MLTLISLLLLPTLIVCKDRTALSFYVLGDWGKGGNGGDVTNTTLVERSYNAHHRLLPGDKSDHSHEDSERYQNDKTEWTYQAGVANSMSTVYDTVQTPPEFVVAVGDNFYSNGVASTTDQLWTTIWKNVYHGKYKNLHLPWYPVFGNHDYGYGSLGTEAQIDRTTATSDDDNLWQFPSQYYSKKWAIKQTSEATILMIFIDTTTLAPSLNKCCNSAGGVSSELQEERIEEQLAYIEATLKDAVSQVKMSSQTEYFLPLWTVVIGHYGVYSSGGKGNSAELEAYLMPMMQRYGVQAYFCGHDHVNEHLQVTTSKGLVMNHFTVGSGCMQDGFKEDEIKNISKWHRGGTSAFAHVVANATTMTVTYRGLEGSTLYTYAIQNTRSKDTASLQNALNEAFASTDQVIAYTPVSHASLLVIIAIAAMVGSIHLLRNFNTCVQLAHFHARKLRGKYTKCDDLESGNDPEMPSLHNQAQHTYLNAPNIFDVSQV